MQSASAECSGLLPRRMQFSLHAIASSVAGSRTPCTTSAELSRKAPWSSLHTAAAAPPPAGRNSPASTCILATSTGGAFWRLFFISEICARQKPKQVILPASIFIGFQRLYYGESFQTMMQHMRSAKKTKRSEWIQQSRGARAGGGPNFHRIPAAHEASFQTMMQHMESAKQTKTEWSTRSWSYFTNLYKSKEH